MSEMNIIDKTIGFFFPTTALRRQVARRKLDIINTGYSNYGASRTKKSLIGWLSRGGSVKEDIDDNLDLLRQRSRDLYMGTPIATGSLKTTRTNVVGSGLKLKSQIDYEFLGLSDDEANRLETKIEREFALWAESVHCDAQRMNNFYELQQLAFLSWLMSGDCFALLPSIPRANMPYDLRVYLIEADRICSPQNKRSKENKIINGVEIGKYGEPIAYWIAQKHPLSFNVGKQEWKRIKAFGDKTGRPNILHLMESERPEQRRGVPILAPVIESLKQLGRYTEAELMAAVVSGMYTVFIETKDPNDEVPLGEVIPIDQQVDYEDENSYELGNGAIIALGEGESIKEANPGRPNTAFDGFVTSICRQIGAALEMPYELLVKQFTASYSASRASLLEAWKMFRMRRSWLAQDFCQPVYEEWLAEAVAKGRIYAPGFFSDPIIRKAYSGAEWNGPSQGQIDPLKEVRAASERVKEGFSTRAKETAELTGGDFNKNYRQRLKEERMMKEILGGEE
ncbi:phage portal protein [Tissierella praeacuta]|uniref:phage portal protein n=1 Tax=Tissierella praeacuta TaxID=43131 RepID=UPI003DA5833C